MRSARSFEKASKRLKASPRELETKEGKVYVKGEHWRAIMITDLFAAQFGAAGTFGTYVEGGELLGRSTFVVNYAHEDSQTGQIDPVSAAKGERLVSSYTHGAYGVEVAVNVETGEVKVLRMVGSLMLRALSQEKSF